MLGDANKMLLASLVDEVAEGRLIVLEGTHLLELFLDAATAFQGSHDTVYEIWEVGANRGPFDPDLGKFRDPERRRCMAALVRRLAELDRRGLGFLERAVNLIHGRAAGPAMAADPVLDGMAVLEKAQPGPTGEGRWAPENIALPNALGMLRAFLGEQAQHEPPGEAPGVAVR